ncbi:MAG TPA: hypothetical protein PKV16_08895 [Caldisericia bacterium]|nr:hypothetical protein [Caldisericia bacterium]HPF49570.1 hypothetical protein [Caldisericia bacterium]HPI84514.1 hypothetical protein [Caldisericia bacterium]HPQ93880.1 hypothetical protein [Caldisericia bacterium]HRV75425.1 hypothetical protein [Caldisericia bacterium]
MKKTIVLALAIVLVFGLVIGCGQEPVVDQTDSISEQVDEVTTSQREKILVDNEVESQEVEKTTEYVEHETAIASFRVPISWQVQKIESKNYKGGLKQVLVYPDPKTNAIIYIEHPKSGGYNDALEQGFEELTECKPNLIMRSFYKRDADFWFCFSGSSHIPVSIWEYDSIKGQEDEIIKFLSSIRK